jgi:DNA-binding Lrp family transcriptional regulator
MNAALMPSLWDHEAMVQADTSSSELDETDRQIIDLLARDGRTSNRALAQSVGVTDATIAIRIRRLVDNLFITVGPQFDWRQAGFNAEALVLLRIDGALPREVGTRLAGIRGVYFNTVTLGGQTNLILILLAADAAAMEKLIARVAAIRGVAEHEVIPFDSVFAFGSFGAILPFQRIPLDELPAPTLTLDELDREIIEHLRTDGRASARSISRHVSVSDVTIKTRIRRMESAGLLRVTAQVDPIRTASAMHLAHFALATRRDMRRLEQQIARMPWVTYAARRADGEGIVGALAARTDDRLMELVTDTLWRLPSVRGVRAWKIASIASFHADLARLL